MELENRIYLCEKCGKLWFENEKMIGIVTNYKNISYYAYEVSSCSEDENCALNEVGLLYEVCGEYNNKYIELLGLKEDLIKVESDILYLVDITTGYLLDGILGKKIWFKKFEMNNKVQQYVYKKKVSIKNNDSKISLKDFIGK